MNPGGIDALLEANPRRFMMVCFPIKHVGVSIVMGVPSRAGWFTVDHSIFLMIRGYPMFFGKLHVFCEIKARF